LSDLSHEKENDPTKTSFVSQNQKITNKIDPYDLKLLDTIARKYSSKIVGESNNIKTLICCFVSKDLPKKFRLSAIISNRSSTGKSYLLNNVLQPFKDDLIDYTDFTEAHFKRTQHNVNGKIIKLEQLERVNDDKQLSIQRLKHLLTEGVLKFGCVDKGAKGENTPRDFVVSGYPVFVTTAVKFYIDSETSNSVFMMELDESDVQTEKIVDYTLSDYSKIKANDEWESNIEELTIFFNKLKKMAQHTDGILIPFAHKLESVIPKHLEIRRDLAKILNLTCVIAFIHGLNRPYLQDNKPRHFLTDSFGSTKEECAYWIIAKPEDFVEALEIAGQTIRQTINKTSAKQMQLLALVKKLYSENCILQSKGVTVKDVAKTSGYSDNRAREHLNSLADDGFLTKDDINKENQYFPTEKKFSDLKPTNINFTKEEFDNWLKIQLESSGERYSVVGSWDGVSDDKTENVTNKTEVNYATKLNSCQSVLGEES
jgi:hypothetical protein